MPINKTADSQGEIVPAIEWMMANGQASEAVSVVKALSTFMFATGRWEIGNTCCELLLCRQEISDTERFEVGYQRTLFQYYHADNTASFRFLLDFASKDPDPLRRAIALFMTAQRAFNAMELRSALIAMRMARAVFREAKHARGTAWCYGLNARVAHLEGRHRVAMRRYKTCLVLSENSESPIDQAFALAPLVEHALEKHRFAKATEYLAKLASCVERTQRLDYTLWLQRLKCELAFRISDHGLALQCGIDCYALTQTVTLKFDWAYCAVICGKCLVDLGARVAGCNLMKIGYDTLNHGALHLFPFEKLALKRLRSFAPRIKYTGFSSNQSERALVGIIDTYLNNLHSRN